MKKILSAITVLAAAFCLSATTANADTNPKDSGVALDKRVTGPDANGQYLITLEAYAKGSSVTTHSEEVQPNDIILVLDLTYSMHRDHTEIIGERISSGTTLAFDTNYMMKKDGKEYFLKAFDASTYTSVKKKYSELLGTKDNPSPYFCKVDGNYYPAYVVKQDNRYYLYHTNSSSRVSRSDKNKDGEITVYQCLEHKYIYVYKEGTYPSSSGDGNQLCDPSSSPYTVTSTDEIYSVRDVTRLEAMKIAAVKFAQTVLSNPPVNDKGGNTQYHSLALVGFNDTATTYFEFLDVNGDNINRITSTIEGLDYDSNTNPNTGLKNAVDLCKTVKDDGRKKVVLFFTDGKPEGDFARGTIACQSVNLAYDLKNTYGATVYSVALLGDSDKKDDDIRRFLHYVSSNYKFTVPDGKTDSFFQTDYSAAVCQIAGHTDWKGSEDPHDYYQLSNGANLSSIFDKIAQEAASGGAAISLNSSTTTVLDVLTADFVLPAGTDESKIGIYVDEVTGYDATTKVYSFANRTDLVPEGGKKTDYVSIGDAITDEGLPTKKIVVTGYDFTKEDVPANGDIRYGNWVGPRETRTAEGSTTVYKGRRLVITIPIEPAPDYQGGYSLPTNTSDSGIYTKKDGQDKCIDKFPIPDLDFPSIGIIKYGMSKGESATFTVQRIKNASGGTILGGTPFMIILTGDGSGKPAYAILKNLPEGTYRVAESMWSWTYEVTDVTVKDGNGQASVTPGSGEASVTTQVLAKDQTSDWPSGIDETVKCVLFTFTNAKKTGDDPTIDTATYAESVVKNKFKGHGVTTPSATTTNSKTQPSK